jgi:cullin 3
VEARLHEEVERVHHYLDNSTNAKIVHVVEDELLSKHREELLAMENSGLIFMIDNDRMDGWLAS